ncbi:replication factor C large subunit [Candidatus Pacearchaeota archaeon]|nr:replication factor C large subunit [Candidatus Pacearchaeota archaeon]
MTLNHESLVEKYRPKRFSEIFGQDLAISQLKTFIEEFPKRKALVLHGPAGTGKTSIVLAAAKEYNLEILELNSSDLRNRAQLEERLKPATEQQSLFKKGKIILMDEVDGVTGTDIGGIPELVKLIGSTRYPIIMTCNDVWQSKLSPVRAKSKVVELKPLPIIKISQILQLISEKEGLKENPYFLNQIAIKSQGDLRAALNDLQSYSGSESIVDVNEKRDVEESIFNILRRIFKEREPFLDLFDTTSLSIDEIFLWIEENVPKEYKGETLARAYHALGKADVFRGRIYRNQSWRFLIYQNIFQSAGISFAKKTTIGGFTKYERPKRVLKIWLHNQKTLKKKTIAKKYAKFVHCSTKRAMRDFELLKPILKKDSVQKHLQLSDEEIEFLNK